MLEFERLKELIRLLEIGLKYGYASNSSPIDILLDLFIEVNLRLAIALNEGRSESWTTPGLRFLDTRQDELGNPKQIRFHKQKRVYWDPLAKEFFQSLASAAVQMKKDQKPMRVIFMTTLKDLFPWLQPPIPRSKSQQTKKRKSKAAKTSSFWWNRRQYKRKFLT